jgi:hypothetical protein
MTRAHFSESEDPDAGLASLSPAFMLLGASGMLDLKRLANVASSSSFLPPDKRRLSPGAPTTWATLCAKFNPQTALAAIEQTQHE